MAHRGHPIDALWRRLMRLQCDLSFPIELHCYHALESWHSGHHVLDLGTGSGRYLYRLAHFFPAKTYVGVDVSAPHIAAAARLPWSDVLRARPRFHVTDYLDYEGVHDFAIARLLVQHLPALDTFLGHVRILLKPGGTLLVIEANDAGRLFYPRLPMMEELFRALRAQRQSAGFDRDAGLSLLRLAPSKGFIFDRDFSLVVPSSVGANKSLFMTSYLAVLDVVRQAYRLTLNYNAVKQELRRWFRAPHAYAEIGVHVASYIRR